MLSILSDAYSLFKSIWMDPKYIFPGNTIAKALHEDSHVDGLRERVGIYCRYQSF